MISTYRAAVVFVLMVVLMYPILLAEDKLKPGNWERVKELQVGSQITVYSKDGNRLEGTFNKIAPMWIGSVYFTDGSGQDLYSEELAIRFWGPQYATTGKLFIGLHQIFLDFIDEIMMTDKISGITETIFLSRGAAWWKEKRGKATPSVIWTPLLAQVNPEPNSWKVFLNYRDAENITIYTKDGKQRECDDWSYFGSSSILIGAAVLPDDSNQVWMSTVDKITTTESGKVKVLFISDEIALKELTLPQAPAHPLDRSLE